jgi:hypothetical protein
MARLAALAVLIVALLAAGIARADPPAGLGQIVRAQAAALGDPSPAGAAVVATTYQRAHAATAGLPHVSTSLPGGLSTDGPVDLVVVDGAFPGLSAAGPSGRVLTMIVDRATLIPWGFDITIGDTAPDTGALGPVEPLELPATPVAAAPAPATCGAWSDRIARLASRATALRRGAAHARPASRRKLALALTARLEKSGSGYRLLADQLCASPPARPASILWQDFRGGPAPGIGSFTVSGASPVAALLPVPLPQPVPDPSCGVRGIAPPGKPAPFLARMVEVTLSTGQRLAYPVCHLPPALAPVDQALAYLSNPSGLAIP